MEKVPMTAQGLERMVVELKQLKSVERHAVIDAIAQARALGDLSENAEYHAAREKQGFIESRIKDLEDKVSRAEVIDVSKLSGDTVKFGATVTLFDEDSEEEITYQIVGVDEADITLKLLSISAPLSRALIGKSVGDVCEVRTPNGLRSYEILKVVFK
jgi:transcription elongation factor GreA